MANFVDPDDVGGGFVDPDEAMSAPAFKQPSEPASTAKKRTLLEEFKRQLGLTARASVTGLTGTSALLADLPIGVARAMGANVPLPSQAQAQLMTRMGLPEPTGAVENIVQLGASMLAGGKDPLMAPFAQAPRTVPLTPREETMKRGMEAGYKVIPSQVGRAKGPLYGLERVAGETQLRETVRERNALVTTKLARRAIGWPDDAPITPETLDGLKQTIHDAAYAPIDKLGQITTGRNYRESLNKLAIETADVSKSFPEAEQKSVSSIIDAYRKRSFDAADGRQAIAKLRHSADVGFRSTDPVQQAQARARKGIAKALEDAVELNLEKRGMPELLTQFRAGRKQFAKIFDVERAMNAPDDVDSIKLAARLAKGKPLTEELRLIAQMGQQAPYLMRRPIGTLPQPLGIARKPKAEMIRAIPNALLRSPWLQRMLVPQEQVISPTRARFGPATYNAMMGLFGDE